MIESLVRLFISRSSGFRAGKSSGAERSSISSSAVSYLAFPKIPAPMMRAVAMPVFMLEPRLLLSTRLPSALNISMARLQTVVLPLVPVTPIMAFGFFIILRKSGHSLIATTPGKLVPLCLVILSAMTDSLAAHSAIKNLILFIILNIRIRFYISLISISHPP